MTDELNSSDIIENELEAQRNILSKNGIDFTLPTEKQIRTSVQFKPYLNNQNYESYLESIENGLYNTWDNAIRTGYMTGMTTDKIISDVMGTVPKNGKVGTTGLIQTLRDSIERNTRTYLQAMATETRNATYEENSKLFKGYKWMSTLDRRTCLVCGNLDGKFFSDLNFEQPPLHYNCRCTVVPVLKDIGDFEEDTRASEDKPVDARLNYDDWISRQPESVQKEILGKNRFEQFKKGGGIGQFVNDGKVMTLTQLKDVTAKKNIYPKFEDTDAKTFAKTLSQSKENMPSYSRWRVSSYEPEHYDGAKLKITKSGSTVAVMKNGDIVSVCAGGKTDRGKYLIQEAIKMGGNKLDSFDGNYGFYTKMGFEPVSWCKFDSEFAPEGWRKGIDAPEDIIFFRYTGKVTTMTRIDFYNSVKMSADYDEAEAVRDAFFKKKNID